MRRARASWREALGGIALCALPLLGSCAGEDAPPLARLQWGAIDVMVETRPSPPEPGNTEVLVLLTGSHREPIHDALIDLRARPDAPWVQAIQDGHTGAYRRAVSMPAQIAGANLTLRLRRGPNEETFLVPLIATTRSTGVQ